MLWDVGDDGKVLVKLQSTGTSSTMLTKDDVNRFIGNIVGDLTANMGVDVVTDELRVSFNKTRPEINVTWRAQVPPVQVPEVREYMVRLSQEHR